MELYAVGWIFLIILGILWFFLPFAIFGTKPKIDKLITEMKRTNELLGELVALIRAGPKQ